jgi:hypothetical protein
MTIGFRRVEIKHHLQSLHDLETSGLGTCEISPRKFPVVRNN